jgi:hypothetical protein
LSGTIHLATPAYTFSLYGKGWFFLKPPFLKNVYYTQNHRLILTVRKKWIGGNMTRSCKKCGFFVSNPALSTKDIGYCLFFKLRNIERKDSGRKLKIIDGEENTVANGCEEYFNTVDYFK